MTDITQMSEQEKSVMLARLCGWIRPAGPEFKPGVWLIDIPTHPVWSKNFLRKMPEELPNLNLYEPRYMEIAWRIVNWAFENSDTKNENVSFSLAEITGEHSIFRFPPKLAQQRWLDTILAIAIKAGMLPEAAASTAVGDDANV